MTRYALIHWRCKSCKASELNPVGKPYIKKCPKCGSKELEFSDNNFVPVEEYERFPFPELTGSTEEQLQKLEAYLNGPGKTISRDIAIVEKTVDLMMNSK